MEHLFNSKDSPSGLQTATNILLCIIKVAQEVGGRGRGAFRVPSCTAHHTVPCLADYIEMRQKELTSSHAFIYCVMRHALFYCTYHCFPCLAHRRCQVYCNHLYELNLRLTSYYSVPFVALVGLIVSSALSHWPSLSPGCRAPIFIRTCNWLLCSCPTDSLFYYCSL